MRTEVGRTGLFPVTGSPRFLSCSFRSNTWRDSGARREGAAWEARWGGVLVQSRPLQKDAEDCVQGACGKWAEATANRLVGIRAVWLLLRLGLLK